MQPSFIVCGELEALFQPLGHGAPEYRSFPPRLASLSQRPSVVANARE